MNKYPTSWNDVSVEQFIELSTFSVSDFESDTDYYLAVYEFLTNATEEEINNLDFEEYLDFVKAVRFLSETPKNWEHCTGDDEFTFIGFNNLTLGNFIDLEVFFSQNYLEKLPYILMVLYRKTKIGEWDEQIFEPISKIDIESRVEEMKEVSIGETFGIISEYLTFRNKFLEKRRALFGMDEEYEEEDEEYEETQEEKLQTKWSWELFLNNLADGDITKIDQITEMNLFFVFNIVGMKKELKIQ